MFENIIQAYRYSKSGWITRHQIIRITRDIIIRIQFHLNRGKSFFTFWIDFAKNIIFAAVGIKFLPDYIPELNFIALHPSRYIIIGSIVMLLFFFLWSQIMDFIQYDQTISDQSNTRNNYMNSILEGVQEINKKINR